MDRHGELALPDSPLSARPDDPLATHLRARLDGQVRALLEHEAVARSDVDPEGVHQMRVAVRRMRAAVRATGRSGQPEPVAGLAGELRWLGGVLARVRDLDVLLGHFRDQTADFDAAERAATDRLLHGLVTERRQAHTAMLATLDGDRYRTLLRTIAAAVREPARAGTAAPDPAGTPAPPANLVSLIDRPHRKLHRAAAALGDDPPDDDLHALRIKGKRLRYAAELAVPTGGTPIQRLIKATKRFQDVLGTHQDAVVAEQEIRRLLATADAAHPNERRVAFVAGRLVERERARRADCRARWRPTLADIDTAAAAIHP